MTIGNDVLLAALASAVVVEGLMLWRAARARIVARRRMWVETVRLLMMEAREALFGQVASGDIDADSATFKTFFFIQNDVINHPDEHGAIARHLEQAFLETQNEVARDNPIRHESAAWSPEVREAIRKTSFALLVLQVTNANPWRVKLEVFPPGGGEREPIEPRTAPAVYPFSGSASRKLVAFMGNGPLKGEDLVISNAIRKVDELVAIG